MAPYALPLRISVSGESVQVRDAQDRTVAYLYFEDDELRRNLMRRWTKAEAIEIAQRIARALTEASDARDDGASL